MDSAGCQGALETRAGLSFPRSQPRTVYPDRLFCPRMILTVESGLPPGRTPQQMGLQPWQSPGLGMVRGGVC